MCWNLNELAGYTQPGGSFQEACLSLWTSRYLTTAFLAKSRIYNLLLTSYIDRYRFELESYKSTIRVNIRTSNYLERKCGKGDVSKKLRWWLCLYLTWSFLGDGSVVCINETLTMSYELTGPDCDAVYRVVHAGNDVFTSCRDGKIRVYSNSWQDVGYVR